MASPFSLFRRHRKILTVILTGLAMFAFIVLDALSRMEDSSAFIPLVTAIVGAAAFWFFGQQSNKGSGFTLVGAAFGAAVGFLAVYSRPNPDGIATDIGTLTKAKLQVMREERNQANQFIGGAVRERKEQDQNAQRYFFGDVSAEEMVEKFLLLDKAEKLNVQVSNAYVNDYILEASDKGLDTKEFNELRSSLNLGKADVFRVLRDELRVRIVKQMLMPQAIELPQQKWENFKKFEVVYEIDAVEVPVEPFETAVAAPETGELEKLFEEFKEFYPRGENPGFRQPERLKLAWLRISRSEIAKGIAEPTEEELKAQYEKDKDIFYKALPDTFPDLDELKLDEFPSSLPGASTPAPSSPSAPLKIEAPAPAPAKTETPDGEKPKESGTTPEPEKPATKTEEDAPKPSDAPVKESNEKADKEESCCEPQPPTAEEKTPAEKTPAEKTPAEEASKATEEVPKQPEGEKPEAKPAVDPESSPDPLKLPDLDGEEKPGETATTDSKNAYQSFESVRDRVLSSVKSERSRDEVTRVVEAAMEQISSTRRKLSSSLKGAELAAAMEKAAREYAAKTPGVYYFEDATPRTYSEMITPPEEEPAAGIAASSTSEVEIPEVAPDTPAEEKPAEEKPAEEKPAEEKPAEEKPSEEKPSEEKPSEEKPSEEKPSEAKPEEATEEGSCQEEPADSVKKPAGKTPAQPADGKKAPNLPEGVKPPEKAKPAAPATPAEGEATTKPEDSKAQETPEGEGGKDTKEETEVIEETPPFKEPEEADPSASIENEIGLAVGEFDFQQRRAPTVAQTAFGTSISLFYPETADGTFSKGTQDYRYVYWGTERIEDHVPEKLEHVLTEVTKAYANRGARPKAEERARAIADHVAALVENVSLEEALAAAPPKGASGLNELTVTGTDKSEKLAVISPPPFSWLTQGGGMNPNPFGPPSLGQVEGVSGATPEFMETVAGMNDSDVKVVPNADRSAFYVVHLKSRTPDGTTGPFYEASQKQFLREQGDFMARIRYMGLAQQGHQDLYFRWRSGLMKEYNVVGIAGAATGQ
jgi:hypothetical protein